LLRKNTLLMFTDGLGQILTLNQQLFAGSQLLIQRFLFFA